MVRVAGGLSEVFGACKIACWKHDYLSALPDHLDASDQPEQPEGEEPTPLLTPRIKAEWLEEINLELTLYFAQLYILVETGREEEDWSDELMSLEPPLPIFLFNLLAMLREKPAKGYPVKKVSKVPVSRLGDAAHLVLVRSSCSFCGNRCWPAWAG